MVVDTSDGEFNNSSVTSPTSMASLALVYKPETRWIHYAPKTPFLVLDKVYPNGVYIPEVLVGNNVVHLPTVKTHVFTTITGAR